MQVLCPQQLQHNKQRNEWFVKCDASFNSKEVNPGHPSSNNHLVWWPSALSKLTNPSLLLRVYRSKKPRKRNEKEVMKTQHELSA